MSALDETEAASAAVAKSPDTRVKLDDIKANVAGVFYTTGFEIAQASGIAGNADMAGDVEIPKVMDDTRALTVCVLVLRNGYTVIGKAAPADPTNFNPELGRKFAYEDAIRQCWPIMGYALREKLAGR